MTANAKKKIIVSAVLVLLLVWLVLHYFPFSKPITSHAVSVTTTQSIQKNIIVTAQAIGNVQPYNSVSIKSRVDGQLLSVGFKEGDVVKEGQILFQIDPKPFQVALEQAQANLARDQAQLDAAKKLVERMTPLVQKGYVAKNEYDTAVYNAKGLQGTILSDEAAVNDAKLKLDYCTIRAPISGRTGHLLINVGNQIKANDTAPLVVINQLAPIYVAFSLPEKKLANIQQEMQKGKVPVWIKLSKKIILEGVLTFIDNAVDPSTGMIQLKATFPNDDQQQLWPGRFVKVTLPLYEIKSAILLPTRAIQVGEQGPYVFVVKPNLHVTVKSIKLGPVIESDTVVEEGLSAGVQVVLSGQAQLGEDSAVTISNSGVANP